MAVSPEDTTLAAAGVAALHDELKAYPKPGLVSPVDFGAHADMDFALMCKSAELPSGTLGAACRRRPRGPLVRGSAEATRHRGGAAHAGGHRRRQYAPWRHLLVGSGRRCHRTGDGPFPRIVPDAVRAALEHEWGEALEAHAARGSTAASHGALVRRKTGRDGARREAALAFPSVFEVGIPTLRQALEAGLDPNAAVIQTLFALMEAVDDTTVLYRGGLDAGVFVRRSAATFLADGGCFQPDWRQKAERLHRSFIERNVSAGGCADLLACTTLVSHSLQLR